jgi:hypothetical protein
VRNLRIRLEDVTSNEKSGMVFAQPVSPTGLVGLSFLSFGPTIANNIDIPKMFEEAKHIEIEV